MKLSSLAPVKRYRPKMLSESFYTDLRKKDMESMVSQFAYGIGRHIHDALLPMDDGLVVQVFKDSVEISGTNGEVSLKVGENAVSIGDKEVLDVSRFPSLGEVGSAMVYHKTRQDSKVSRALSDGNLIERIESEVRKHLGL